MTMTTITSKTIMYSTIVFSMLIMIVGINNVYAASEPDRTDYVSIWKIIDEQIRENQKQITEDELEIQKLGKNTSSEKSVIEQRISEKNTANEKLWKKVAQLEQLNIKSYQLDPETKSVFDKAEQNLIDKYLNKNSPIYVGTNGVQDISVNAKHREILVVLDISRELLSDSSVNEIASIVSEIKSTVSDVDVKVEFGKLTDVSCTQRTSTCNPSKGGVQIERQNSGGSGSTMAFKATHGTHGNGFVIAGHEGVAVNNNILQPKSGTVFGTVKVMGGSTCDCAFVKLASGKTVDNTIWAPEVGSTYPIATRVAQSAQQPGTFVNISGVGSGVKYGDIYSSGSDNVRVNIGVVTGDSGAPVYKPLASGSADLYGMIHKGISSTQSFYEPWHHIKSDMSLTD